MRQQIGRMIGLVGGIAVLLLTAGTVRQSGAAPAEAPITLEIPAGIDLKVVAPTITYDQTTKESTFSGPTTLTWPNGANLTVPSGGVRMRKQEPGGRQLIRIERPAPGSR